MHAGDGGDRARHGDRGADAGDISRRGAVHVRVVIVFGTVGREVWVFL